MLQRAFACCLAAALIAPCLSAADSGRPTAGLKVSELTAVPGKTLAPGSYTIHVLDHLSDRYIVEVDSANKNTHTLFIGIVGKSLTTAAPGEIKWPIAAGGAQAIRGWKFPSLPALEFAYPKNDAVAIAKANGTDVPAIDPESDNIQSAQLTPDEEKIVTLWLLTPTAVSPTAPAGISAKKLSQVAAARKPVKLPKTASELPLVALLGMLAFAGALGLRRLS